MRQFAYALSLVSVVAASSVHAQEPIPVSVPDAPVEDPTIKAQLDAMGSVMNRALALDNQGLFGEAEPLWRKALAMRIDLLGPGDSLLVPARSRLATNLEAQGRYTDAESLRRASVELLQDRPNEWKDLANARNALSYNLLMQGQASAAATEAYAALALWRGAGQEDDIGASQALSNTGLVLNRLGLSADAELFHRRAAAIRQQVWGDDDLDTATSFNNLAASLSAQGKYAEADEFFRKALAIRTKSGIAPALVAENTFNIAMNLHHLEGAKPVEEPEAEAYFLRSIELWSKLFGARSAQAAAGYNGLGMNQFAYSRFDAAEENIRRGLDIRKRVLGGHHPDVAESYANLGMVKRAQGDSKSARRYLKRALTISERYGVDLPATRDIRAALDSL